MTTTEPLRDAYHDLESSLDAAAAGFAESGAIATRDHLGEVCLTAQLLDQPLDARYEFREGAAPLYAALQVCRRGKVLEVRFRPEIGTDFTEARDWAWFDTLSKLLILEGLEAASAGCDG